MTLSQKASLFFLRISLGWLMFYAGLSKLMNPQWSATGYLKGAKNLVGLYSWLGSPDMLPVVNFLNEWGPLLIGISLLLGIGVRLSSLFGALLMMLYYLPILDGWRPSPNSLVVDQHIIFLFAFLFLSAIRAGRIWGLENWCANLPICSKIPGWRSWFG